MPASAQQVKQSLSIADSILALAAKKNLTVVDIATEDLQALVDEVKRLSKPEVITITPAQKACVIKYYHQQRGLEGSKQNSTDLAIEIVMKYIGIEWEELQ